MKKCLFSRQRFYRPSFVQAHFGRHRLANSRHGHAGRSCPRPARSSRFPLFEGDITHQPGVDRIPRQEMRRGAAVRWPSPRPRPTMREIRCQVFELDFEANLPIVRSLSGTASGWFSPRPRGLRYVRGPDDSIPETRHWSTADQQTPLDLRLRQTR